ncbi:MAG: hypothetical protein IPL33_22180 [Sphingobacteriales bacterium]|nr:hypothetical protein [Sphingobacteriales bacterium]
MKYLIIFSIFCLFLQACEDCLFPGGYVFDIPATLSPAKDTFNIGDTITISSIFSDQVYDKSTEQHYKLENFKFYPETFIYKIDTIRTVNNLSEFDFIIDPKYNYYIFSYSTGDRSLIGQYNYANNTYSLEYQIIPKVKGLYGLNHSSSIIGLGESQDFEGRCRGIISDVDVTLNEGADNNVNFLLESPDEIQRKIWEKRDKQFHRFGGYCFYVK